MKASTSLILLVPLVASLSMAARASSSDEQDVLARRGEGVVTHELFDARVSRIPEQDRARFLRDRSRLQELLNQLLLQAQLAADARLAGLQDDPDVQARMQFAAEEELAKAWLQRYPDLREPADYEALAREHYDVSKERYTTEETRDLTHILIGLGELTDAEALERATELRARIAADTQQFDELVTEYSDDPSAASNQGHLVRVKRGQMVEPFEAAAFALAEGEISEPVRSRYGYHIIRLDRINPAHTQSFDEVHDMLVDRMRRQHQERVRNNYLTWLTQQEVEMTEEALEAMVARYFDQEGGTSAERDSE